MNENDNTLHTKEHRRETSATSYLHYTSAHPRYTFKGIIKSQLYRIRRLCSREEDYIIAAELLKQRCTASDYKIDVIEDVFDNYKEIPRDLNARNREAITMVQNLLMTVAIVSFATTGHVIFKMWSVAMSLGSPIR